MLSELLKKGYLLRIFSVKFKPCANGRNIADQQLPTLMDVTCCVRKHTLLHVVASCCVLLGVIVQSLKPVKLLAICKRTQQLPTLLGQPCSELIVLQVEFIGYSLF